MYNIYSINYEMYTSVYGVHNIFSLVSFVSSIEVLPFELKLIVALGFLQSFRVIQTLSFISRLVLVRESPPLGGARISIIVKKK